jgi:hypothetical protein
MSKNPSSAAGILHGTPDPCNGVEVVPAVGGHQMQANLCVPVLQCGGEFVGPMETAVINTHHDLFGSFAKDVPDVMPILVYSFRVEMRRNPIADCGGAIRHGPQDAELHPARAPTPRALRRPRLTFEPCFTFELTLAQRARGQARALCSAPLARPGPHRVASMACERLPSLDSPRHATRHPLALPWRGAHHRKSARRHRTQDNDSTEECPATRDLADEHQDPDGI